MRFNTNGGLDSSFNNDGQVVTQLTATSSETHASVITPDLKIVLAGHNYYIDQGMMARYYLGPMLYTPPVAGGAAAVHVYPNPAGDKINITAAGVDNGFWQLGFYDLTGRQVFRNTLSVTNGSIGSEIVLKGLPDGVYLLQLDNGKTRLLSRIIKHP